MKTQSWNLYLLRDTILGKVSFDSHSLRVNSENLYIYIFICYLQLMKSQSWNQQTHESGVKSKSAQNNEKKLKKDWGEFFTHPASSLMSRISINCTFPEALWWTWKAWTNLWENTDLFPVCAIILLSFLFFIH